MFGFLKKNVGAAASAAKQEKPDGSADALPALVQIAEGNFAAPIPPEASGQIAQAVRKVQSHLSNVIAELNQDCASLEASSKELTSAADGMLKDSSSAYGRAVSAAKDTESMNGNMNSISAATEELSANFKTISDNARQSADNVSAVATATEEMSATIKEIAKSSESARNTTASAVEGAARVSTKVQELEQAALGISKVLSSISDISDQTKLLALNATIEAARAGEAGRGFAVVAGEVKELAQQTNTATVEIKTRIENMQKATRSTISEIESIKSVIEEVNHIVGTIAAAVEQQSATTREIAGNISTASAGIGEMTKAVEEGASAVQEVNRNISGAADLSGSVAASAKELMDACSRLKRASTLSYAGVMEVSSRVSDTEKVFSSITLPKEKAQSLGAVMELFRFTESYSVFVADRDNEHKGIFNFINKIHQAIKDGKSDKDLLDIFKKLGDFTASHFAKEEDMMRAKGFPELDAQLAAHKKLLDRVASITAKLKAGEEVNMIETLIFLKDWLQNHILKMDKRYGEFFKQKGLV